MTAESGDSSREQGWRGDSRCVTKGYNKLTFFEKHHTVVLAVIKGLNVTIIGNSAC